MPSDERTPSSTEAGLERLMALVIDDADLRARLLAIEDRQRFLAEVVAIAGDRGISVRAEELEAAMQANQRAWIERKIR